MPVARPAAAEPSRQLFWSWASDVPILDHLLIGRRLAGGAMHTEDRGFTIIELLIVTVIIGILAAVAIPKFTASKEKAYLAAMASDLRNLATAQEAYHYDEATYYDGAVPSVKLAYNLSSGVSITISDVTGAGWAAVTSHLQTGKTCAIFMGAAPVTAPAVTEGQVKCL